MYICLYLYINLHINVHRGPGASGPPPPGIDKIASFLGPSGLRFPGLIFCMLFSFLWGLFFEHFWEHFCVTFWTNQGPKVFFFGTTSWRLWGIVSRGFRALLGLSSEVRCSKSVAKTTANTCFQKRISSQSWRSWAISGSHLDSFQMVLDPKIKAEIVPKSIKKGTRK